MIYDCLFKKNMIVSHRIYILFICQDANGFRNLSYVILSTIVKLFDNIETQCL